MADPLELRIGDLIGAAAAVKRYGRDAQWRDVPKWVRRELMSEVDDRSRRKIDAYAAALSVVNESSYRRFFANRWKAFFPSGNVDRARREALLADPSDARLADVCGHDNAERHYRLDPAMLWVDVPEEVKKACRDVAESAGSGYYGLYLLAAIDRARAFA